MTQTAAVAAAPRMDARRARPGAESRASEAGSEPHAAGPPSLVCRLNSPRATARPCRPVVDANTVGRPPFPAPTSCGSSPSSPRKYKRRRSCQRRRFSRARHPPAHPPARPPPPHDAAGCRRRVTETGGTRCAEGGDRAAPRAPARLRLPGRAPQAPSRGTHRTVRMYSTDRSRVLAVQDCTPEIVHMDSGRAARG